MAAEKSKRGGARTGAGRKPGAANKATAAARAMAEATGETPLEFMLRRMRDEDAPMDDRMDMAKAAAPFVHSKLSSVEAKVEVEADIAVSTVEYLVVDPASGPGR